MCWLIFYNYISMHGAKKHKIIFILVNTFAASYLNTQGLIIHA